jgi:hypothetical protein
MEVGLPDKTLDNDNTAEASRGCPHDITDAIIFIHVCTSWVELEFGHGAAACPTV